MPADHQIFGTGAQQQVRHRLEIAGTLLHADDAGNLVHDLQHRVDTEIVPRNHVVDEDRNSGLLIDGAKMSHCRVEGGLEQIMRGRHLKRVDLQAVQHPHALHRLMRGVDDQSRNETRTPVQRVMRRPHRGPELRIGQRVPLAGRPARDNAADTRIHHEVDLRRERLGHERPLVVERHGQWRHDTRQLVPHRCSDLVYHPSLRVAAMPRGQTTCRQPANHSYPTIWKRNLKSYLYRHALPVNAPHQKTIDGWRNLKKYM